MSAFIPMREQRWHYASDAMDHVEERNCALGCKRGLADPAAFAEFGPGGTCDILARVCIGDDEPIPELDDDGETVTCLVREEL